MFEALNRERSSRGLNPLVSHACAELVATIRARDLAARNYFAHESPDGETAISLLNSHAIPYSSAGENLARNNYPINQSLDVAVQDLMASAPHRGLILNATYTHPGVAAMEDAQGMKYYVMILLSI